MFLEVKICISSFLKPTSFINFITLFVKLTLFPSLLYQNKSNSFFSSSSYILLLIISSDACPDAEPVVSKKPYNELKSYPTNFEDILLEELFKKSYTHICLFKNVLNPIRVRSKCSLYAFNKTFFLIYLYLMCQKE